MNTQRFEREYQEYHGLSARRRHDQLRALGELEESAGKPPEDCTASEVKQYLASLKERGLHDNTIRKNLNLLKPFFGWAWEANLIDADRLMELQRVAPPRKSESSGLPRPYSRKELARFREEFDRRWPKVHPKFWKRWRKGTSRFRRIQPEAMRIQIEAIVALALHCGLRQHEIFLASVDEIHFDNAYVVVSHGKGGKTREVPHTETSRAAVKAWIEIRAELKPKHDHLWLSLAWEEVAANAMHWTRFKGILLTIGDWQLHRFRHTAGTEWLRATRRIEIVQKLLGHSNIQQTLGYAKLVRDDLHDAIEKSELKFEASVGAEVAA